MHGARSSLASSANWKRLSGCLRATAKPRRQERLPQPRRRPPRRRRLLHRDQGARALRAEEPAGDKRTLSTLGDQVLALANGRTQPEIAAACKGARPNHVSAAIARYKRAWPHRRARREALRQLGDGDGAA